MTHSKTRLIGYARVSTDEQDPQLQIDALAKAGVAENHIHIEYVSGAARRRPILDKAIKDCRRGDTLLVWRLDRFARSMPDLVKRLQGMEQSGIGFRSLTEGFEVTTATGRLILHIMGAIAEFERQLIRERTKAGMEAARKAGRGRPLIMTEDRIATARRLRSEDPTRWTYRALAEHFAREEGVTITAQGIAQALTATTR